MPESVTYIIVQAGGRGSRMELLTRNKPKALVPVENRPMLFHLFEKYPKAHFIIIGDYCQDVLEKYLKSFASAYDYELVHARGAKGTCAGLGEALQRVPSHTPFFLIWCDLILSKDWQMPDADADYIGIADGFSCRWKFEEGHFAEERSSMHGVAGAFLFQEKERLAGLPAEGAGQENILSSECERINSGMKRQQTLQ